MKKFLIIKIGAIGDVIMMFPLLKKIKEEHPESTIDFIAGKTVEPVISLCKEVDTLFIVNDKKLLIGSALEKTDEILNLWGKIAFKNYDLVINAHSDKRYKLLQAVVLRNEYRSLDYSSRNNSIISIRYHADEYLRLFTGLDDSTMLKAEYPLIEADGADEIKKALSGDGKYIVLAPGGAKNLLNDDEVRRLPATTYVETAKQLSNNYKIVLCGGPDDVHIGESFKDIDVINLIGRTTLKDLIYILNKSELLITHDTGILHFAKITKAKLLGLFGAIHPLGRIKHMPGKAEFIWKGADLACSPCYNGKNFASCSDNVCMKLITAGEIITKAKTMLEPDER